MQNLDWVETKSPVVYFLLVWFRRLIGFVNTASEAIAGALLNVVHPQLAWHARAKIIANMYTFKLNVQVLRSVPVGVDAFWSYYAGEVILALRRNLSDRDKLLLVCHVAIHLQNEHVKRVPGGFRFELQPDWRPTDRVGCEEQETEAQARALLDRLFEPPGDQSIVDHEYKPGVIGDIAGGFCPAPDQTH